MPNVYHDSQELIADMQAGHLPKGSVVKVQWPSGNSEAVRFHYWRGGHMMGCNLGWDNSALDTYDLTTAVVSLIEKPKPNDERWKS